LVSWGLSRHVLKWYIGNVYVCSRRKGANKEDHYEHPLPRIPTDTAEHEYGEIRELQTRTPRTQPEGLLTLNFNKHCWGCWQILIYEIIAYINIARHFVIYNSNVFWSYFHGYFPQQITHITFVQYIDRRAHWRVIWSLWLQHVQEKDQTRNGNHKNCLNCATIK